MANKILQIYFYFSCLLYFLGFKNFAIFIAKRKLPTFKISDENAFKRKSKLKNIYDENYPYGINMNLINDAKNSRFSIRQTAFYFCIFKMLKEKKDLNILEIGGGAGSHYFSIKEEIGNYFINKFYICDLPIFKELSRNNKFPSLIEFLTLDELMKLQKVEIDILQIAGTLQYVEEYKSLIEDIKKLSPKFIVLYRIPLWNKGTKIVNQWDDKYPNCFIPSHVFNEKEIDSLFKSNYIKLPYDFGIFDLSWVIPFGNKFPIRSIIYKSIKKN